MCAQGQECQEELLVEALQQDWVVAEEAADWVGAHLDGWRELLSRMGLEANIMTVRRDAPRFAHAGHALLMLGTPCSCGARWARCVQGWQWFRGPPGGCRRYTRGLLVGERRPRLPEGFMSTDGMERRSCCSRKRMTQTYPLLPPPLPLLPPPQDVDRDSMLAQEDPSLGQVLVRVWTEDYDGERNQRGKKRQGPETGFREDSGRGPGSPLLAWRPCWAVGAAWRPVPAGRSADGCATRGLEQSCSSLQCTARYSVLGGLFGGQGCPSPLQHPEAACATRLRCAAGGPFWRARVPLTPAVP